MDRADDASRSNGLLEDSGPVRGGVKGRPAARDDQLAATPDERAEVRASGPLQSFLDKRGLAADHVVHVERVTRPRIRKADHGRASRSVK